jgi:hypothetical protein
VMPSQYCCYISTTIKSERATDQLVKKVILSVDILNVDQGR